MPGTRAGLAYIDQVNLHVFAVHTRVGIKLPLNCTVDGTVDGSSADQKIRKLDVTVCNLGKIWRPAPSRTQS